jgi:hypothetical protein
MNLTLKKYQLWRYRHRVVGLGLLVLFCVGTTQAQPTALSKKEYYNKVLGLLVGSAIGDAMGAPTEMWQRRDIEIEYGRVYKTDSMVRAPSPEGTWKYNLPAGGTTDDTRWKKLAVEYALTQKKQQLDPKAFADHLIGRYQAEIKKLKNTEGLDPEPYEEGLMRMAWLQEWVKVAKPYRENDLKGYMDALSKFYGGEMTCAGMLYAPVVGAVVPGQPERAYAQGYDLALFDIGYARDITALVAAMSSAAFDPRASPQTIMQVVRNVDPQGYFKSRLVGRRSYAFYQLAKNIAYDFQKTTEQDIPADFVVPKAWLGVTPLEYYRISQAYAQLDKQNEDLPFHAAEIMLIAQTAMLCHDFDFEKSMAFIINYGRDNDTVAAVAGAILGAYYGAERLPAGPSKQVMQVCATQLGIDLEKLARDLTEKMY